METRVVNVKDERPDVYIGRGSDWGNPFKIGVDGDRAEVIAKYRRYLWGRKDLLDRLEELDGQTLGCHCAPLPCHGDVLIAALQWKKSL